MADLYNKQANLYGESRPTYPPDLFSFIASKTPNHDLAWDAGTGSGQAAASLAGIYKNVVATDTSAEQLRYAPKLPNIRYLRTPTTMTTEEVVRNVASEATVDVVTVASAIHWFDLPTFYGQVNRVLRRPNGVIAAWCYTEPRVNESVDAIYWRLFYTESQPFWAPARKLVDDEYKNLDFPFHPVDGMDHTGPFKFEAKISMDLEKYMKFIRSWSGYQTAKEKGIELLSKAVVDDLERAWGENKNNHKTVSFPLHLRIGRIV